MRDLLHDLILVASWPALAVWARWYFPQIVSLIADRGEPAVERRPAWVDKTVTESGGIAWPSGGVWLSERWQVGA